MVCQLCKSLGITCFGILCPLGAIILVLERVQNEDDMEEVLIV